MKHLINVYSQRHRLPILWGILICFSYILFSCHSDSPTQKEKPITPISDIVINYLAHSDYINPDFSSQTIGKHFRFEHADRRNGMLYLSMPKEIDKEEVGNICKNTASVEYGEQRGGTSYLAPAQLRDSTRILMRFPFDQFAVDTTLSISCAVGDQTYALSLHELRELAKAKTLYNSPALFVWERPNERPSSIANHAAPIAKKDEPTLIRLVSQIIADSMAMEQKAQRLLDFVSSDIAYQSHGQYEIFMKPHEVLLSGRSDCSGKVVLYASLLEQVDIPYILVYLINHICVAIPGDFSTLNQMNFEHEGQQYFIAETTTPGFQIGETFLQSPINEDRFVFLQKPGFQTKLFDISQGDSLDFVTIEIEVTE